MLFEPREGGAIRHEGRDTIYPVALGAKPGSATLNITALANMSSTLTPNAELLSTFRKKGDDVAIVDQLLLSAAMCLVSSWLGKLLYAAETAALADQAVRR